MADVTVRRNEATSRYEAVVDGEVAGFIGYAEDGATVDLQHTEVDDAYEGQGVGSALVRTTLEQLRQENPRPAVVASCQFVAGYIDRHPEFADLLGQDR